MSDLDNIRVIYKDGRIVLAKIENGNIVYTSNDIINDCIIALMYKMSEMKNKSKNKECYYSNPIGELHFKEYGCKKD